MILMAASKKEIEGLQGKVKQLSMEILECIEKNYTLMKVYSSI